MGLSGRVLICCDALESHRVAWDKLAVAACRPFCSPGWLVPWWRHVADATAELRVVAVHDGDELVGLAPFFATRDRRGVVWRPLGAGTCQRVEPLARAGREAEVAACMAKTIAAAGPHVVTLEGVGERSPWPGLLVNSWPGRRPWVARRATSTALTIGLGNATFDAWFMGKTSHFRQRLRTGSKALARGGGQARLATQETLTRDVEAFIRLHRARWSPRGGSRAVTPAVEAMLGDVANQLGAGERLRVWSLDLAGETIASSLVLRAGSEVAYWLNGFDERQAALSPSRLSILTVVEDAFTLGAERLDLGEGDFEYKRRFADGEELLHWLWLVPPRAGRPITRARVAPGLAKRIASERLPATTKARLKRLAGER